MAEEFKLSPEEAVILRTGKIGYGRGFQLPSMFNSNELILTNKNLILLRKNMFGQTEDTLYFPLSKILMANGRPQVKKSNPSHMDYALDVYFETGMESFRFEWESDIDEWVENIVSVVTGVPVQKKSDLEMMQDALAFAESMTDSVEKIQSVFGIKSTRQVSCKCPSCGASLSGTKGETIQCPYCGTTYTF